MHHHILHNSRKRVGKEKLLKTNTSFITRAFLPEKFRDMKMQWFLISLHPPPHPPSSKYPRTEKFWHWISHLSHISPFYVPSVFLGLSWGYVFLSSFPSISLASFSLADTALSGRTFSCFPFLGETGENGWSFLLLQYAQSLYGNHLETERADWLHTLRISRESEPNHLHPEEEEVAWLRLWYQTVALTTLQSEWCQNKI